MYYTDVLKVFSSFNELNTENDKTHKFILMKLCFFIILNIRIHLTGHLLDSAILANWISPIVHIRPRKIIQTETLLYWDRPCEEFDSLRYTTYPLPKRTIKISKMMRDRVYLVSVSHVMSQHFRVSDI